MWIDALEATIDQDRIGTHWEGCYLEHKDCAIMRLIAVARAGRELAKAGKRVANALAWAQWDDALAAFREAETG